MKALFLVFHGFSAYNGISKKIHYQVDALKNNNVDTELCYLDTDEQGQHKRMVGDKVIENFGKGVKAKIAKRRCYKSLIKYIIDNKVDILYIRSAHNSNLSLISFIKTIKKAGVKVLLEIPTFPYDGEYKEARLSDKIKHLVDRATRKIMAKYIDKIVTFTHYPTIFGVETINISNGIDFTKTELKKTINDTSKVINFIGVAEIHFWHGFDRFIEGLANYYSKEQEKVVIFNIVGEGLLSENERLQQLVNANNLEKYVIFHGRLFGKELDEMFEKSDIGVASLGRHRSQNHNIKTLKNREYTARGIAFIYSEIDDDFENMPYIIKAPADESPIDIKRIVEFYENQTMLPNEIRTTISHLSWDEQMKKVIDKTLL